MEEAVTSKNEIEPKPSDSEDNFLKPMEPPPLKHSSQNVKLNHKKINKLAVPLPVNYVTPEWSAVPPSINNEYILDSEGFCDHFFLEVIKNGSVVEKINLNKSYLMLGRFEDVDILAEHPTISRYHVIFQYSTGLIDSNYPEGFYLYDLGSTHGTFLNKTRVEPNKYTFIPLDSILKFGQSTRLYVLHGPKPKYGSDDLKINLTHDQMKKIKEKHSQLSLKLRIRKEVEEEEKMERLKQSESSVDWGMSESDSKQIEEDADDKDNQVDESYFSSDPKKALKNYFDREGHEFEYEIEELAPGKYKCRIDLPITNDYGETLYAEVVHEGKKKESIVVCSLEACRMLNAEGVLKQSSRESAKNRKKEKDWESADFYDSDDDSYYDRTGDIERKRQQRMANAGKIEQNNKMLTKQKDITITFDMILKDIKMIMTEEYEIESKLDKCKQIVKAVSEDDIDAYIKSLKTTESNLDALTRAKMKKRLAEVKNELIRLEKLCNVAKPKEFQLSKWKEEIVSDLKSPAHTPIGKTKNTNKIQDIVSNKKEIVEINNQKDTQSDEISDINIKPKEITLKKTNEEKTHKVNMIEIEADNDEIQTSSAKKMKITSNNPKENYSYEQLNPYDYDVWQPPKGQSGDGRTSLNDKYGY